MPMRDLNVKKAQKLLSRIMEFELAGVVRYTHYSLMVAGPNRIPIVAFLKAQASESLLHAQQAGEILTGLGGHPTLTIAPIPESYKHSVKDILEESLSHERDALDLYCEFLDVVAMSEDELLATYDCGGLTDGKTIAALFAWRRSRGR